MEQEQEVACEGCGSARVIVMRSVSVGGGVPVEHRTCMDCDRVSDNRAVSGVKP